MYYRFFGLNKAPFKITPDTSLFYSGAKRGATLDALVYAVLNGEGIVKVVGEVGSGKTMLCRMLEVRLPRHVDIVYINNPSLSPDNILQVVAYELAVVTDPCTPKLEAMQKLNSYLTERHAEGAQVVVFLEEAQGMPLATLEEVRLLSNLETEEHKLMQLVMFGQPELDEKLKDPSIRQLRERITHSFDLEPLKEDEIMEYLNFRLWLAGYRGADLFTQKVARRITAYSHGLIRRVNILADKTLLAAYSDNTYVLTPKHVEMAARDSQYTKQFNAKPMLFGGAGLAASLAVVGMLWLGGFKMPEGMWPALQQTVSRYSDQAQQWIAQWREKSVPAQAAQIDAEKPTEKMLTVVPSAARLGQEIAPDSVADGSATDESVASMLPADMTRRLADSLSWIQSNDPEKYSVRLLEVDVSELDKLQNLISELPNNFEQNGLYLLRHEEFDVTRLTLVYSEFTDIGQAEDAIAQMPDLVLQWGPDVQSVRALKSLAR